MFKHVEHICFNNSYYTLVIEQHDVSSIIEDYHFISSISDVSSSLSDVFQKKGDYTINYTAVASDISDDLGNVFQKKGDFTGIASSISDDLSNSFQKKGDFTGIASSISDDLSNVFQEKGDYSIDYSTIASNISDDLTSDFQLKGNYLSSEREVKVQKNESKIDTTTQSDSRTWTKKNIRVFCIGSEYITNKTINYIALHYLNEPLSDCISQEEYRDKEYKLAAFEITYNNGVEENRYKKGLSKNSFKMTSGADLIYEFDDFTVDDDHSLAFEFVNASMTEEQFNDDTIVTWYDSHMCNVFATKNVHSTNTTTQWIDYRGITNGGSDAGDLPICEFGFKSVIEGKLYEISDYTRFDQVSSIVEGYNYQKAGNYLQTTSDHTTSSDVSSIIENYEYQNKSQVINQIQTTIQSKLSSYIDISNIDSIMQISASDVIKFCYILNALLDGYNTIDDNGYFRHTTLTEEEKLMQSTGSSAKLTVTDSSTYNLNQVNIFSEPLNSSTTAEITFGENN